MNRTNIVHSIILLTFCLSACVHNNTESLMNIDINGLDFKSSQLLLNNKAIKGSDVPMDSTLEFRLYGLHGFKIINYKAFVGTSMFVEDSAGKVLFHHEDIFSKYDSMGTDTSLINRQLGIYLEIAPPMKQGACYTWHIKIWDLKKENNYIQSAIKIKII